MTKAWKTTLSSILVLVVLSFISVVSVLALNALLPPKTTFFDKQKLQKICPATSYSQLTADDLYEMGVTDLEAYNQGLTYASIRAVFVAEGGENDGRYIIEAEGSGYSDKFAVIMYVAYNEQGEIIGVTDLNVDKGNTFWGDLKPYLKSIYDGLIGKSGDVGSGSQLLTSSTGATQSMNGIARAVNASNAFVMELLQSNAGSLPTEVTDQSLLQALREITDDNTSFIRYPFTSSQKIGSYPSEVTAVYISSNDEIIFQTKAEVGGYGRAVLLVLVDAEHGTVVKINPLSLSAVDHEGMGIESEFLFDSLLLSEMFSGLAVDDIFSMDKYLTGSTGATQTSNGIKYAVIVALDSIEEFLTYKEEVGRD